MNWRLKCLAFHLFEHVPGGRFIHSAAQRLITRRYFRELSESSLATPLHHVRQLVYLPPRPIVLEFGSGRNLLTPLLMSWTGASRIYTYDLHRLATLKQVNQMIQQLARLFPGRWPLLSSLLELENVYRIVYCAPSDVKNTGLSESTVDLICSTATNEHIPMADLTAILAECRRVACQHARFSFLIDYHDHFGSTDRNISKWNFYRYSDQEWVRFNPKRHYQNRLRHCDHEQLFREAGLHIRRSERIIPDWAERHLEQVPLSEQFAHYSRKDLITASGRFLLQK